MTYTIEEIIGAWYECYGEYMEDEYEGFIQLLKNKIKINYQYNDDNNEGWDYFLELTKENK